MTVPSYDLIITEPYAYTYSGYESADAWDKHIIQPGVYPVEFVDSSYRPARHDLTKEDGLLWIDRKPYYARIVVASVLMETYYVNKLGSARSVQHKTNLNKPTTVHSSPYAYEIKPGYKLFGGEIHERTELQTN